MNRRYSSIDYLKAICIVIVVFSHTFHFNSSASSLAEWMQIVFLRGFFFATGWLYAQSEKKTNIKEKSIRFVIQYFTLSAIMIVIQQLLSIFIQVDGSYINGNGMELLKRNVLETITFNGIGTIWFLPIIFIVSIAVILISRIKNDNIKNIIAGIIMVISFVAYGYLTKIKISNNYLVKEMQMANRILMGVSIALFGFLAGQVCRRIKTNLWIWIGVAVISIGIGKLCINYKVVDCQYFLYTLSLFAIAMIFEKINLLKNVLKPLSWLGKKTLYIMVIHYFIWVPICAYIFNLAKISLENVWNRLLLWLLVLAMSIITTLLASRIKAVKYIFGESKKISS